MMHLRGFKSKKDLIARVKAGLPVERAAPMTIGAVLEQDKPKPLVAARVCEETSIFGAELKRDGKFAVCLDHPRRSKFAEITVRDGIIVTVK